MGHPDCERAVDQKEESERDGVIRLGDGQLFQNKRRIVGDGDGKNGFEETTDLNWNGRETTE